MAPALTAKSVGASGLYPLSMMSSSAAGPRLWGSSNMASDTPGLAPSTLIWNWYSRQGLIPETIHLADFPADLWLFEASSQISDDTYKKKLRIVAVSRNAENFLRFMAFKPFLREQHKCKYVSFMRNRDTGRCDTQHNDIHHNDIQHNSK